MQINPIAANYRSTVNRQKFGAKFTDNAEKEFRDMGYHYLTKYGENSDEFSTYSECMSKISDMCPETTIDLKRDQRKGIITYISAPGTNQRIAVPNNGLFNMNYLIDLLKTMYKFETEYKSEKNPNYLDNVIDNIFKG